MEISSIKGILVGISFILLLSTVSGTAAAQNSPGDEAAIKGYDPVAYFVDGEAKKGDDSYTFRWQDRTWYFSSRENRDLFAASPEKYAPQYDGYCAWAMTEGRKAETDPEVWKIVDGKLYLNCSMAAYEKWSRNIDENIKKADKNWSEIRNPDQR